MESKTGKYFTYAIGEIILVVIGILIALQINNWNENKKLNISLRLSLLEVQNNLLNDSIQLEKQSKKLKRELKLQQEIIELLADGKSLDSSFNVNLGVSMTTNGLEVSRNGYKNLQVIGLERIKNKNLENLLIKYYDILGTIMEEESSQDEFELLNVWLPYVRKNFWDYEYRQYGIPKSYEALSSDRELFIMLKSNIYNREATLDQFTEMEASITSLIDEIKKHMK